jgi:hypothetical protein
MNQKLTYEQTITGKLEALPVPDMEAAIWKRIEFQLDIDMPSGGDADATQPPRFPKPGPLMLGAVSIVFLTVLLVYYLFKDKDHTNPTKFSNPITAPTIVSKPNDREPQRPVKKVKPSSSVNAVANPSTILVDSNRFVQPTVLPPDSNALIKDRGDVIIIPPAAPGKDAEHIPKKKKGVKGLTDEDYRIVPGNKDSLP